MFEEENEAVSSVAELIMVRKTLRVRVLCSSPSIVRSRQNMFLVILGNLTIAI